MNYVYTISMVTENKIRVLQRIASVLSRNRLNVMNMNVHEIANTDKSHFSISFASEEKITNRVVLQLQRIIEVLDIKINSKIPLLNN